MALTKVTGGTISSTSSYQVGVITATKFVGPIETTDATITGGSITATDGTFSGNVSIAGTLTYEDVTSIDSVGIITAKNNIDAQKDVLVGAGLSVVGVVTATSFSGSGAPLTALNASNIGSGTVPTARLGSGTANNSVFLRGDSSWSAVTQTTINNNADNRLITGSGTANTLNGESALTFDGNIFTVTQSAANINIVSHAMGSGKGSQIKLHNDHGEAYVGQAGDTTGNLLVHNTSNTHMLFATNNTERLRITSAGALRLSDTNSPNDQNTDIWVADDVLNFNAYATNGAFIFKTGSSSTERLRIKSNGIIVSGNSGTSFGNAAIQAFIAHGNTAGESGFSSVDTTSVAAGVGGEITFHGKYNTGAQDYAYFGHIRGTKENATAGNTACALKFFTRPNATAPIERLRINSSGHMILSPSGYSLPTGDERTLNIVAWGSKPASLGFQRSNSLGGTTSGWTNELQSNGDLIWGVHNVGEKLRITSGGNIGVAGATGTDFSLLDGMVVNVANGSAGLLINSSSSSHNAYLGFSYGSGSSTSHADQFSAYIGRVGDNQLIFGTNNVIRGSFTSAGHFQLQGGTVYGDDSATATFKLQSTSGNSNHARIEIGAIQSSDNGGIHFYTAGSSAATRHMTLKGTSVNL